MAAKRAVNAEEATGSVTARSLEEAEAGEESEVREVSPESAMMTIFTAIEVVEVEESVAHISLCKRGSEGTPCAYWRKWSGPH
jgi:hypothetical protein